jgi:hypothetical protein
MDNGQRDARGRFTRGNSGGPGRPRREVERGYLATMAQVCDISVWRQIVLKAVEQAKRGDHRAREWLSRYLVATRGVEEGPIEIEVNIAGTE